MRFIGQRLSRCILRLGTGLLFLTSSLGGTPAGSQAQDIAFERIDTRKLWITEHSQFFNLTDEWIVFENMGNKRDGLFAHLYDINKITIAKDKIRRSGVHFGKPYMQILPDVSGNRVAYLSFKLDTGGWDVYVYNYYTKIEQRLTNTPDLWKYGVAISGDHVVWVERPSAIAPFEIHLYDLTTNTERRLTTTPEEPHSLDAEDHWIAWADKRYDAWGNSLDLDVFVFDLERNREQRISTGPPLTTANSPALSGDFLVWADGRNNPAGAQGKTNIFMKNLTTGQQSQLTNGEHETNCVISGDRVVYQDLSARRTHDWVLIDTLSGQKTGVLPKDSSAFLVKLSSHHIAYVDIGALGEKGSFYLATLP